MSGDQLVHLEMMRACLHRYTRADSSYRDNAQLKTKDGAQRPDLDYNFCMSALSALREDVAAGCLDDFEALVETNTLSGLLKQARRLNEAKHFRPAAALAGAALEEHLHFLCERHQVELEDESGKRFQASQLNQDLKRKGVYEANARDDVENWQKIRNRAVHPPKPGEEDFERAFNVRKIERMLDGIEDFIREGYESLTIAPH